jgi:hypothetical protein
VHYGAGLFNASRSGTLTHLLVVHQGTLAIVEVILGEQQVGFTHQDFIPLGERRLIGDPAPIDERPVPAAHVLSVVPVGALVKANPQVLAGDQVVEDS